MPAIIQKPNVGKPKANKSTFIILNYLKNYNAIMSHQLFVFIIFHISLLKYQKKAH